MSRRVNVSRSSSHSSTPSRTLTATPMPTTSGAGMVRSVRMAFPGRGA